MPNLRVCVQVILLLFLAHVYLFRDSERKNAPRKISLRIRHRFSTGREEIHLRRTGFCQRRKGVDSRHPHRSAGAEITFDGEPIRGKPKRIYLMLNKPAGYVTTVRDERGRPTVMALVSDISERIYPVGRLDLDTEGLLLMTNDGDFAHRILHPSHEIQKTYTAWVEGHPHQQEIQKLREGIEIEDGVITSAKVNQIERREGQTQFKVVIHEGKKRQIRRMFHAVGHDVVHLKRVGIGLLSLGQLAIGKYRILTATEIESLDREV